MKLTRVEKKTLASYASLLAMSIQQQDSEGIEKWMSEIYKAMQSVKLRETGQTALVQFDEELKGAKVVPIKKT